MGSFLAFGSKGSFRDYPSKAGQFAAKLVSARHFAVLLILSILNYVRNSTLSNPTRVAVDDDNRFVFKPLEMRHIPHLSDLT